MSTRILFPDGFGYVPASLVSLAWVLAWQTFLVVAARRRAGVEYPQMYAEQAEAKAKPAAMQFNCTQRVHQNTLESAPIIALSTLVFGLKHPHSAAALCASFVAGRVIYTLGYKTGKPARRIPGAMISTLSMFALLGSASYTAYSLWPSV